LVTIITTRLGIKGFNSQNDRYCNDQQLMQQYIGNATKINSNDNGLILARNTLRDSHTVAADESLTPKIKVLPIICWLVFRENRLRNTIVLLIKIYFSSFWKYRNDSLAAVTQPETKQFISDMISGYFGHGLAYLCLYHRDGSKQCSDLVIPPLPESHPRSQSLFIETMNAIARISSITKA
jgi:hypothetical protein